MPTVNAASPRGRLDGCRARFDAIRRKGGAGADTPAPVKALFPLPGILVAVLPGRTTRRTDANSGIPPSRTERDGTARRTGRDSGRGAEPNLRTGADMGGTTVGETVAVDACDACGADLPWVAPAGRGRRVPSGIVPEVGGRRVEAGARECPDCRARTEGRFPDSMPGPLRYGTGLQAFTINLPGARMLSPPRAVAMVQAVSGPMLSEATCLGYIRRLRAAPGPWEEAAVAHLLERPALHADGTGFRVDGRRRWLHVPTDGSLTLKFPHRRRGCGAIGDIGVIPRYTGTLVHDCWASYLTHHRCTHRPFGSHLLRGLTSVVESNGFRWARLMERPLRGACHRASRSDARVLPEAGRRSVRRRYRTILTQGGGELPEIPPRPKGRRGRVAGSDAHSLHGRLGRHGGSVPPFMADPDVSFTDNAGERKIRMARVRIKVSGRFRTQLHAEAWCRISSYLSSMAALGYNPLVAIQIALAGNAADMVKPNDARSAPRKG